MKSTSPLIRKVLCTVGAILLAGVPGALRAGQPEGSRTEQRVGPGVTYIHESVSSGPLNYCVLRVDLSNPKIHLETEKGDDRLFAGEKVRETASRDSSPGHTVIGAINADFWASSPRMYMQIGVFVDEKMIYNSSLMDVRSVLAVTREGNVYLGPVSLRTTILAGEELLEIEGINDLRATSTVSLYTPPYGPVIPAGKNTFYTLRLDRPDFLPNQPVDGTVTRIDSGTSLPLIPGHVVMSVPPGQAAKVRSLKTGSRITLKAAVPEVEGVIEYCVGGGPRLVRNGQVSVEFETEKMGRSFSTTRHPRTAVGIAADGKTLYMVVVDGRQPGISIGASLDELARYMLGLGCYEAINLDGGGSSTMVVRGEVVNRPSDRQGPRTVANALLVVGTGPTGPLAQLAIEPRGSPLALPTGIAADFAVRGYDTDFNPFDLSTQPLTWSATGGIGRLVSSGTSATLLTAGTSKGTVSVAANESIRTDSPVEVMTADSIHVDPDRFVLSSGEKVDLAITASSSGTPLLLQPQMIQLDTTNDSIAADLQSVAGMAQGQGHLEVAIGPSRRLIPYYVDRYRALLLESFDQFPTTSTLEGINFDRKGSQVALNAANRKQGTSSLAFTYSMTRGGTSQIILPVDLPIVMRPEKIGIWIHGDGKETWIRGDVLDSLNHRFMLDFTEGSKGCYWNGEWKHVMVPVRKLIPRPSNPGARIVFPAKIRQLYVAQDQEALKATGTVLLDGLEAIYAP